MQGWVIVYLPGGDVYQLASGEGTPTKTPFARKVLRQSVKTLLTCAQVYWWFKG